MGGALASCARTARQSMAAVIRTYDEECRYLEKLPNSCAYKIKKGFVPNMKVCNSAIKFPVTRP